MEIGKTRKYLKYAIGEIVLVVIGILIALQINNWNETRKEFIKSRNYIIEFKHDLAADTIRIGRSLEKLSKEVICDTWALSKIQYTHSDIDSLLLALNDSYYDTEINDRTFNNIQNSGSSKLAGYDSLFVKLSHYYIQTNKRMKAHTEWDEKEVTDGQPYMKSLKQTIEKNNNYILQVSEIEGTPPFPMITDPIEQAKLIISFATSVQGRNHFKDNFVRHVRVKRVFAEVIDEAKMILDLIETELNK